MYCGHSRCPGVWCSWINLSVLCETAHSALYPVGLSISYPLSIVNASHTYISLSVFAVLSPVAWCLLSLAAVTVNTDDELMDMPAGKENTTTCTVPMGVLKSRDERERERERERVLGVLRVRWSSLHLKNTAGAYSVTIRYKEH